MGWKLVFQQAESAKNRGMASLLVNRYPNRFFTTSRACKDRGEFLLDDSNYSASSSPQADDSRLRRGVESIFTFGRQF